MVQSTWGRSECTELWFWFYFLLFFKILFIYLFLEKGEGREKERERNITVRPPLVGPPLGTWPATQMCPGWEPNQRPFGLQAGTQSTEPQQPGRQPTFSQLTYTVVSVSGAQHAGRQLYITYKVITQTRGTPPAAYMGITTVLTMSPVLDFTSSWLL